MAPHLLLLSIVAFVARGDFAAVSFEGLRLAARQSPGDRRHPGDAGP